MSAPRLAPSDYTLARWKAEGLTGREMVLRHLDETGIAVRPGTIYAALSRAGLTERRRYDALIPWKIKPEHDSDYRLVMLRLAARVQNGERLPLYRAKKYVRWVERLQRNREVVHYDPKTGWHYVPARPGIDNGFIREVAP